MPVTSRCSTSASPSSWRVPPKPTRDADRRSIRPHRARCSARCPYMSPEQAQGHADRWRVGRVRVRRARLRDADRPPAVWRHHLPGNGGEDPRGHAAAVEAIRTDVPAAAGGAGRRRASRRIATGVRTPHDVLPPARRDATSSARRQRQPRSALLRRARRHSGGDRASCCSPEPPRGGGSPDARVARSAAVACPPCSSSRSAAMPTGSITLPPPVIAVLPDDPQLRAAVERFHLSYPAGEERSAWGGGAGQGLRRARRAPGSPSAGRRCASPAFPRGIATRQDRQRWVCARMTER